MPTEFESSPRLTDPIRVLANGLIADCPELSALRNHQEWPYAIVIATKYKEGAEPEEVEVVPGKKQIEVKKLSDFHKALIGIEVRGLVDIDEVAESNRLHLSAEEQRTGMIEGSTVIAPEYAIVVDSYTWDNFPAKRKALLHHALMSIDATGDKVKLRKPDINLFSQTVKRFGTETTETTEFASIILRLESAARRAGQAVAEPEPMLVGEGEET